MKKSPFGKPVYFGLAAAGLAAALWRHSRRMDLQGRVVLITGGSHGLGLALACEFAKHGSRLVLCARSEEELQKAKEDLTGRGAKVMTIACDVGDRDQVERAVGMAEQHFEKIDVLVNNAGIIHVGPVDSMTLEDFESAMNVMFWGTVYTALAVLPGMRARGCGRIVNITSVGAKVSIPHLLPYSCAKFAAAAFSEGLRAEMQGTGVKVVTIAPGLMRTGSYLNAVFKGSAEGEAAWFGVSSSLPLLSISAAAAARQIVAATRNGEAERILGVPAKLLAGFHGLFPGWTADILGLINRALPQGGGTVETGANSRILQQGVPFAATKLGRDAAKDLLQPTA
ncbi:MAG: SDR family oxidoreductase [Bryobacteraceae bacterium]